MTKIHTSSLYRIAYSTDASAYREAPGTSCRQQIKDGTGVVAVHPIEILTKYIKK